jgi:CheY-like chemotaxis protein
MVVDDERAVRQSWSRYLTDKGFEVATAADGDAAIADLSEHPADAIVSDLRMPGPNGLELLAWVQGHQPDTPFILLTGYGNDMVEKKAEELGAFQYLNKPIAPDTLASILTAATHLGMIYPPGARAGPDLVERPADAVTEAETADAAVTGELAADVEVQADAAADQDAEAQPRGALRSTGEILFGLIVAPILGLLFVIFLPLIGLGALAWVLTESLRERLRAPVPTSVAPNPPAGSHPPERRTGGSGPSAVDEFHTTRPRRATRARPPRHMN